MKALVIDGPGAQPKVTQLPVPEREPGMTLVRTLAAPLNPIDFAVAAGTFYGGHPPYPYVPGNEVVGEVVESDRWPTGMTIWAGGGGAGTARHGGAAEFALVADTQVEPVPTGLDPALAGALGQAGLTGWLATTWKGGVSASDRVLVLGATGSVGFVALQSAKLAGAVRIVAAGRETSSLETLRGLGAHEIVHLGDLSSSDPQAELGQRFTKAFDGDGPTLIIDPLWGAPATAALSSAATGARLVQLGQSAGAETTLTSAAIRGRQLAILGFSILAAPADVRGAGYARLCSAALGGEVHMPLTRYSLDDAVDGWAAHGGTGTGKVVIIP
ncbi:zinc-binding alcohol dehydrogenase family protein [Streptomyces sp. NBC_00322]|uniref:quinone oxidoreductase family protein n=1 Tax=Streptomyces sp. NBC_00322 TaxID=2975712 RepID=UPI002E2B6F8C|nr:zinc-binding alcohol dehydrogenase family protein [Streptomyces sp. NBC_00322]